MVREDLVSKLFDIRESYDMMREHRKIQGAAAFFVLFKSCVGLGIFSYPYAYGKAGMVYGAIMSFFVCYVTTYGMYRLTEISSEIEEKSLGLTKVEDYHFLSHHVAEKFRGKKLADVVSTLAILGTILNNVSVIISSVIEISTHLQPAIGLDKVYVKLAIVLVYLAISAYALEPEKLKVFGLVSGAFILFICAVMYLDNARLLLPQNQGSAQTYEASNLANTGIFLGMSGFAYEACGTIFTVRMTLKDRSRMPRLIVWVFSFIGTVFVMFSVSFYFAYGKEGLRPIAFEFYEQAERPFMYFLGAAFCLCLIMFVPMYNIADSELLEHYQVIGSRLKNADGEMDRSKLLLFRWTLFLLSCAPAFLTDKIELVMNLGGSLVIPVISFYIPVALNYMDAINQGRKVGLKHILHDSFIVLCGLAVTVLGLIYSIQDALKKNDN